MTKKDEYIINPDTNRKVKKDSRKGKEITKKYGGAALATTTTTSSLLCFKPSSPQLSRSPAKSSPTSRSSAPSLAASAAISSAASSASTPLCISKTNSCQSLQNNSTPYVNMNARHNVQHPLIDNPIIFLYHMLESFQYCLNPTSSTQLLENMVISQNGSPPTDPPKNVASSSGDCEFDLEFEPNKTKICNTNTNIICQIKNITPNCIINKSNTNTLETNKTFLNKILEEILKEILQQLCAELKSITNVNAMSLFQGVIAGLMMEAIVDMCKENEKLQQVCNNKYLNISGNVILKMKMADPTTQVSDIVITIMKTIAKYQGNITPLEGQFKKMILEKIKQFIIV